MAVNLETLQIQFEIRDNTGSKLKKLQKQLAGMGNPEIDADTEKAEKKIQELQKTAEDAEVKTEVDADTKKAEKKIDDLEKSAKSVKGGEITVDADTAGAIKKINSVASTANNTRGTVNIGGDDALFREELSGVKNAADGTDGGDADIGGDTSGFDDAKKQVEKDAQNIQGGSVTITAFTESALEQLKLVTSAAGDIPTSPETTPQVNAEPAMAGLRKIYNGMKALGLLKAGEAVFDFAMSAVDTAYAGQAVENQIANLGGEKALEYIDDFAKEMNQKFGLNETGLKEMAKNFSAVFKGSGMGLDDALEYGVEMARYAVDYASALDKTPGEIADTFMSIMNGNTEMARNVSIYGLTADSMDAKIAEMTGLATLQTKMETANETQAEAIQSQIDTLEADIEKNKALYKAQAFFDIMKTNADVDMGFTGDWERTFGEYGNQKTVLGEQWKTLKEDIGEFLTPAAAEIVSAMNGILEAITNFTAQLGQSTFAKDVDGYFGTMTVDDTTMKNAINHVTEPVTKMTTVLESANAELKTATDLMSSSYEAFLKVLMISGTDGDLSDNMDEIEEAGEELANDALFYVTAGRVNLIERLNIFTGGLLEAETNAMVGIVNSYFDQAEEKVKQRKKEFDDAVAALKKENTPENLQQVKDKAFSMMQEAYTLSAGYIGSDEYDWLRSTYKSGQLSAQTISEWMAGMNTASSEEQGKLNAEYEKARRDFVAIGQQVMNQETGSLYTITELNEMFGAFAGEYTRSRQDEAKSRRLGFISELLLGEYGSATADIYDRLYNDKITGEEAVEQITTMVKQLEESGLIFELSTLENRTPAMEKLLNLEYGLRQLRNDHLPTTNEIARGEEVITGIYEHVAAEYFGTGEYDQVLRDAGLAVLYDTLEETGFSDNTFYNPQEPEISPAGSAEFWEKVIDLFPDIGDYFPNASSYLDSGMNENALSSFVDDLAAALGSIPEKIEVTAQLNIGGYEFGQTVTEYTNLFNTSTG